MLFEITFSCKYFNTLLQCVSACAHFQLWMEASHPRMLLILNILYYRVAPVRLFLQWRKYFVGITSYEVAAVLCKWRTEGQRTILRAGMINDLSSTHSPPQPNPTQPEIQISPSQGGETIERCHCGTCRKTRSCVDQCSSN